MLTQELQDLILKEVVNQVRNYDFYGAWAKKSDENILEQLFLSKPEKKSSVSLIGHCEVDPKAILKIHAYFKAIGVVLEKLSGLLTSVVINIDEEGNGIILIYAGRLILLNKVIRDANRFHFKSLEDMVSKAQRIIESSLELVDRYEQVTKL